MEVVKFEGRVSLAEISATFFRVIGTSGNNEAADYNSLALSSEEGPNGSLYKCMYGSKYTLSISPEKAEQSLACKITLIDGMNVDRGFVSFRFESLKEKELNNKPTLMFTLIVPNSADIVKMYKIGDKVYLNLQIDEEREDAING